VSVQLYIYDDLTGQPLKSLTNQDVCNPCSFNVTAANRKAIGNLEGIVNSVGGLPRPNVTGYMIFVVNGDVGNVDVSGFIINSHTGQFDVSVFSLDLQFIEPEPAPTPEPTPRRIKVDMYQEDIKFDYSTDYIYTGGLPGTMNNLTDGNNSTANVELRLYDDMTGLPLRSATNQEVCNPCTTTLSAGQRKNHFSFNQLILNAGGFPRPNVTGFATFLTTGDTRNVFAQEIAANIHASPNDVELFGLNRGSGTVTTFVANSPTTFIFPHVLEKQGTINNTQFTFDTSLFMTYYGGLSGFPAGAGATVDLYVFDQTTGQPMKSATNQNVCNPCTYNLGSTGQPRKRIVTLDDEIVAKGGFPSTVVLGFAVAVINGDVGNLNITSAVTNAKSSALDLSVFVFEPQPLEAAASPFHSSVISKEGILPEALRRVLSSEYNFSHFRDRMGKTSNTTFTFDSEFHAAYTGNQTATLELYLYDQMTSAPLLSATNQAVCNPCSLPMNSSTRKRQIIIDDLITSAGGFPRTDVAGFAKIKVSGDAGRVGILGTLVNSHTGPNDLSTSLLPSRLLQRRATDFDFDGDGRADLGVFRPLDPNGPTWYIMQSGNNQFRGVRWGLPSDTIVPQDFDGDNKTDIAVWRPSPTEFWILQSSNFTVRSENFGLAGDNPSVTADFDGDGKADPAVYRNGASPGAQSYFYYRGSLNNPNGNITFIPWGVNGDKPLRGDFDGDGKADPTVFRPSNQMWYIFESRTNTLRAEFWGLATDTFVPADYDGDGRTDLAVWRNGAWHIRQSSNDFYKVLLWGIINDKPIPADFDGDGRVDIAIFRNGIWYIFQSNGGIRIAAFGLGGDIPLPLFPGN
jgi:hypothetical protein